MSGWERSSRISRRPENYQGQRLSLISKGSSIPRQILKCRRILRERARRCRMVGLLQTPSSIPSESAADVRHGQRRIVAPIAARYCPCRRRGTVRTKDCGRNSRSPPTGRTAAQLFAELNRLEGEVRKIQAEIDDLNRKQRPFSERSKPFPLPLTGRELQVLRGMAWGFTSREIGHQLGISDKSIDTYRMRGFAKLGLKSRFELMKHAVQHGWLILPPDWK